MKKAFNECFKAVVGCEEESTGRKRCELFREIPDRRVRALFLIKNIAVLH
jgi:ATP-dependent helicase STH1/SNF2